VVGFFHKRAFRRTCSRGASKACLPTARR